MRTYYIIAVQSPDQSSPVVYRSERHSPRYEGEMVGSYTQAYCATTVYNQFAAGTVKARSREDALSRYFAEAGR